MVDLVVFGVATLLVLGGAVGVVTSRNAVHSALLLVTTLIGVAVYFVMQQAHLLAAVQVIVYASAIVVLFLFVIMLLGVDRHESLADPVRFQRPVALVVGGVVLAQILFMTGRHWATGAHSSTAPLHGGAGNVKTVGEALFTDYLWPFELTAALLVIAVVGGVVLARRSGQRSGDSVEDSEGAP
ncbi:MAG: NADH-quinone oxidoreductase subunit J [Acidimicrobiia bacterium]